MLIALLKTASIFILKTFGNTYIFIHVNKVNVQINKILSCFIITNE